MKLVKVESSVIESVGYDEENNTLAVQFLTKKVYFYLGIPTIIWEKFVDAESKGSFFSKEIKGQYSSFTLDDKEVLPIGTLSAIMETLEKLHTAVAG